jgi:hypothetical protein
MMFHQSILLALLISALTAAQPDLYQKKNLRHSNRNSGTDHLVAVDHKAIIDDKDNNMNDSDGADVGLDSAQRGLQQASGSFACSSAGDDAMCPGQSLSVGRRLTSPNKRYHIELSSDGYLVLYQQDSSSAFRNNLWFSPSKGSHADMQDDGNLVLYDDNMAAQWSTGTYGQPGNWLRIQDDGNLVLYGADGTSSPRWATSTNANTCNDSGGDVLCPFRVLSVGQRLTSPNKRVFLELQSDGNLVLYKQCPKHWKGNETYRTDLWSTNTSRRVVTRLENTWNGNVALKGPDAQGNDSAVWRSGTIGNAGAWLRVQDDGNLVLYGKGGTSTVLWTSDTSKNGGCEVPGFVW